MNVDEMKAGPELDALVAERIMGWPLAPGASWVEQMKAMDANPNLFMTDGQRVFSHAVPHEDSHLWEPSTCIACAWEVVEKIKDLGEGEGFRLEWDGVDWEAGLLHDPTLDCSHKSMWSNATANAKTAALAICRAALKAVGYGSNRFGVEGSNYIGDQP